MKNSSNYAKKPERKNSMIEYDYDDSIEAITEIRFNYEKQNKAVY
jgi:hypothetical protein